MKRTIAFSGKRAGGAVAAGLYFVIGVMVRKLARVVALAALAAVACAGCNDGSLQ